ncbi:MAG: hypothetical protein KDA61_17655, partial [Planctomycetales bacterium]|nr:hypothetical protein [Planctomycetales bacterium]
GAVSSAGTGEELDSIAGVAGQQDETVGDSLDFHAVGDDESKVGEPEVEDSGDSLVGEDDNSFPEDSVEGGELGSADSDELADDQTADEQVGDEQGADEQAADEQGDASVDDEFQDAELPNDASLGEVDATSAEEATGGSTPPSTSFTGLGRVPVSLARTRLASRTVLTPSSDSASESGLHESGREDPATENMAPTIVKNEAFANDSPARQRAVAHVNSLAGVVAARADFAVATAPHGEAAAATERVAAIDWYFALPAQSSGSGRKPIGRAIW